MSLDIYYSLEVDVLILLGHSCVLGCNEDQMIMGLIENIVERSLVIHSYR